MANAPVAVITLCGPMTNAPTSSAPRRFVPEESFLPYWPSTTPPPEASECHVRTIHEDSKVYTGAGIQTKSLDTKEDAHHLHNWELDVELPCLQTLMNSGTNCANDGIK